MVSIKTKLLFRCQQCGSEYPKWQGQCTDCQQWNTIVEEMALPESKYPGGRGYAGEVPQLIPLTKVNLTELPRITTEMVEFDRVLGGGLVRDSVVLLGGDPGVGKSTLLLQLLSHLPPSLKPLYVTGEESLSQVAERAKRLDLSAEHILLLAETQVELIIAAAKKYQPSVMVIDSVQTIHTELSSSAPGGVGQVRESTAQLVRYAKQFGVALFLVGHVTKEGSIAGPRVLEHMVDTVLYFQNQNDSRYRVVRAVKNRFGAVNELGVFAMTERGLKTVSNPSAIFLSGYQSNVAGSVVMVTWEGSRPLLVEVQALVDQSHMPNPRRVTVGLDQNRLSMLLAILHRHCGIITYDQDVFINVVGGLRLLETGADLAVLLAVLSSLRNKPLPAELVVFGEVGLAGEIRPVQSGQERIYEAAKHGFRQAIVPKANIAKSGHQTIKMVGLTQLSSVLEQFP